MFLYVRETYIHPSLRGTKQSQTVQDGFAKLLCKEGIASCLRITSCRIPDLRSFKNFVSLSAFAVSAFRVFYFDTPMTYLFQTKQSALYTGNDSPRRSALRGRRPSLLQAAKRVKKNFAFFCPSLRKAERGADERSDVGVSRLCAMHSKHLLKPIFALTAVLALLLN